MPLPSGNRIALIGCSTRAVVREQHGSERAARAVHPGPSTAHDPVEWAEKGILTSECPSLFLPSGTKHRATEPGPGPTPVTQDGVHRAWALGRAVDCASPATFSRGAHDSPTVPHRRDRRFGDRLRRRAASTAPSRAGRLLPRGGDQRHRLVARRPHRGVRPHVHRRGRESPSQRDLDRPGRRLGAATTADQPRAVVVGARAGAPTVGCWPSRRDAPSSSRAGPAHRRGLVPPDGRTGRRSFPHSGCRRRADLQPGQQVDRVHQGGAARHATAAFRRARRSRRPPTNASPAESTTG